MGRFGHESLIRYGNLARLEGRRTRMLRPRTVAYAALLTGLTAGLLALLSTRVPFDAAVARAPGSTYTVDDDGWVRNTYLLRISNNLPGEPVAFTIGVEGLDGAQVTSPALELAATEGRLVPVVVRLPGERATSRSLPVRMRINSTRAGERVLQTTFMTAGDGQRP
jgi:polyferredoxin